MPNFNTMISLKGKNTIMHKLVLAFLSLAAATSLAAIPLPEHPRPDFERTQWLNLNGSFGYTHAEYKDYQANDSVNYKGNNVPYAPKYTYSIGRNRRNTRNVYSHAFRRQMV